MWYFSWVLGTALAASIAITCGIWLELRLSDSSEPMNQ